LACDRVPALTFAAARAERGQKNKQPSRRAHV
jgi:hypothetical protein